RAPPAAPLQNEFSTPGPHGSDTLIGLDRGRCLGRATSFAIPRVARHFARKRCAGEPAAGQFSATEGGELLVRGRSSEAIGGGPGCNPRPERAKPQRSGGGPRKVFILGHAGRSDSG